jgi:hypothetical protein
VASNFFGDAELLLHARRRVLLPQALYICRDIKGPDRGERQAALLAPGEETGGRPGTGPARVRVAMLAVKNSTYRQLASSPMSAISAGTTSDECTSEVMISASAMAAGSWVLVGSKVRPLPSISRMIKDVIMPETHAKGWAVALDPFSVTPLRSRNGSPARKLSFTLLVASKTMARTPARGGPVDSGTSRPQLVGSDQGLTRRQQNACWPAATPGAKRRSRAAIFPSTPIDRDPLAGSGRRYRCGSANSGRRPG